MSSRESTGHSVDEIGLIGGLEKREVVICEYDDRWPEIFRKHSEIILKAIGNVALRIEHIGSTSVPGLAAKPIVDILVVVPDPGDERTYLPSLVAAGYELRVREPEFDGHRMVRTSERDIHIHIFPPHSKEIDRYVVFRDQLRTNAADRIQYEQVKRTLAKQDWEDVNEYAEAKSEVVELIISKGFCTFGGRN